MAKVPPAKPKPVVIDDDDSYLDEPKPRTSILNLILCILNLAGVAGFAYCLVLDLDKRQTWSYAVFLHDLAVMGLPLKEEDEHVTASRETVPRPNPRSEQLQEAVQKRKPGISGPFAPPEQPVPVRILPGQLNDEVLKDHFGDFKPYVRTLEDEVDRVQGTVLKDIEQAADEIAAAADTPEKKKQQLEKVLLPLAANVFHARALDKIIHSTEDPVKLDELLKDAVQRRLLVDMLEPIELSRPGDVQKYLEKVDGEKREDPPHLKLEVLKTKLSARLANATTGQYKSELFQGKEWETVKKDSIEKRQNIAFLLFAIAHAVKPDGTPLYGKGPERVQLVVGLNEFSQAAGVYEDAEKKLQERLLQLIADDRDGVLVAGKDDAIERFPGFIDNYKDTVKELRAVQGTVGQEEKKLKQAIDQSISAKNIYESRVKHLEEVKAKLVAQRGKTAKTLAELREMQAQLFRANLELADAAEINFRLEIMLRKEEGLRVPGGPAP